MRFGKRQRTRVSDTVVLVGTHPHGMNIEDWVDFHSKLVVTFRYTDPDTGEWEQRQSVHVGERYALDALSSIALYKNLELVSAELVIDAGYGTSGTNGTNGTSEGELRTPA